MSRYVRSTMNWQRAGWARDALLAFGRATGQRLGHEPQEMIGDLICDLLHYTAQNGIDPQVVLSCGERHFDAEAKGEE